MKKIRIFILISIIVTSIVQTGSIAQAESLEELERKQEDLNRQIQENYRALSAKKLEVNDIQSMVNSLDSQITAIEKDINFSISKIDIATQKINALQEEITKKEEELKIQKENLFETMRVMYETPQQSTVEIIVGSNSLSEVIDRAQYIEALKYQIETTINVIYQLKTELENERNQVEGERTDLENQKKSLEEKKKGLDSQKEQKNQLLNKTAEEKRNYQNILEKLQSERSQISSEIYALRRARGDITFGTSDYPWGYVEGYTPDPWLFYLGECVSYASWYWNAKLGKYWTNTQPGRGSARYWDEIAATLNRQGYNYTVSSTPQVGAFVVWRGPLFAGDQWGHVAVVEGVNSDGTIDVSEFNYARYHSYSYRTGVSPGDYYIY